MKKNTVIEILAKYLENAYAKGIYDVQGYDEETEAYDLLAELEAAGMQPKPYIKPDTTGLFFAGFVVEGWEP